MTTGVVTATIASSETVEELKTLTGVNEYSITIDTSDATSTTAADLNAINALTSVPVNLTNVIALAASDLSDLDTLAAAITDNEFSSVAGIATLAVSDITIDASALASTIDSYDEINGESTTGMTLAAGATINVDASEVTEMLDDETAGRLTISDQAITVTGEISVDTANLLNETTSGVVTASIATTETVDELITLAGTGNAYTIVIAEEDATGSTASELTTIDNATTVVVDATAVNEVTGSNLSLIHI